jgi:excisionase family DNA binding protein|tara:strand:+ start:1439 stop:1705 length:267 start_codon:yes stop_codon:yes gene_type:complete
MSQLTRILQQARSEAQGGLEQDGLPQGAPEHPIEKIQYTYKEAAFVMGLSTRYLMRLVKEGRLKAVRFGKSTRIRKADLEQLIEDHLA